MLGMGYNRLCQGIVGMHTYLLVAKRIAPRRHRRCPSKR